MVTSIAIQHYLFGCIQLNCFQELLTITNNSIKNQSFVYIQLNDQTLLFQPSQSSISFVCFQFKCQAVLFDPYIGPYQVLPLQARVDLGVMAMKGYSTFPQSSSITGTSPSDCFVSYSRTLVMGWWWVLLPLQRCSRCILQPCRP